MVTAQGYKTLTENPLADLDESNERSLRELVSNY